MNWRDMRHRIIQTFLRLMGEAEEAFVRDQNDRLAHALRRMQKENDTLERRLLTGKDRCANQIRLLLASIDLKKRERNYFRDQLHHYHQSVIIDVLGQNQPGHDPTECRICAIVRTKHPLDVTPRVESEAKVER